MAAPGSGNISSNPCLPTPRMVCPCWPHQLDLLTHSTAFCLCWPIWSLTFYMCCSPCLEHSVCFPSCSLPCWFLFHHLYSMSKEISPRPYPVTPCFSLPPPINTVLSPCLLPTEHHMVCYSVYGWFRYFPDQTIKSCLDCHCVIPIPPLTLDTVSASQVAGRVAAEFISRLGQTLCLC